MPNSIHYTTITKSELNLIEPLWEVLNDEHYSDSVYFKDHYTSFSFEQRSHRWIKWDESKMHILVALNSANNPVGYAVSTIDDEGLGELDSLCVKPDFQNLGIGRLLTIKSIDWLKDHGCEKIRLGVSYGHESVFGFYQKLGFYPKMTLLELKENV